MTLCQKLQILIWDCIWLFEIGKVSLSYGYPLEAGFWWLRRLLRRTPKRKNVRNSGQDLIFGTYLDYHSRHRIVISFSRDIFGISCMFHFQRPFWNLLKNSVWDTTYCHYTKLNSSFPFGSRPVKEDISSSSLLKLLSIHIANRMVEAIAVTFTQLL